MVICILLGKVKEIQSVANGRTSLIIQTVQPYRKRFKKFVLENDSELGEKLNTQVFQRDSEVKISYESTPFVQALVSIESVPIDVCSTCQRYIYSDQICSTYCETCTVINELDSINRCLKLINVETDAFDSSFLTFKDDINDVIFTTKLEGDYFMSEYLANFTGSTFFVNGETLMPLENGDIVFELNGFPELRYEFDNHNFMNVQF